MADAVLDNPILNGPYDPPTRHWRFDDSGITDEVVEGRRTSGYFVPVPQARQQSAQLAIETEWTLDRLSRTTWSTSCAPGSTCGGGRDART